TRLFFFSCARHHRHLHSFPTRRSSDLDGSGYRGRPIALGANEKTYSEQSTAMLQNSFRNATYSIIVMNAAEVSFLRAEAALRNRSEEHTSELQSQSNLVCRLLLEKKKK